MRRLQYSPHLITTITGAGGKVLYERRVNRTQVFSKDAADDALRLMGKNRHAYTSPTASRHDAWALSITPDSVTAVWLGHDKAKTIATKAETTEALESLLRRVK